MTTTEISRIFLDFLRSQEFDRAIILVIEGRGENTSVLSNCTDPTSAASLLFDAASGLHHRFHDGASE